MRIRNIELENIRSHKNSKVEFEDGITIIEGRTGAGKSSILMGIEYALFGSNAYSNSLIMRRGSSKAKISMEFEQNGHLYKVIRGLKRNTNGISLDIDNMKIYKDGKLLNLLGRKSDIDKTILEILGYPNDVKGKELFEIITYTRQDEIRKLIDMKKEERQEYIDRVLQLSKYKMTVENMKGVLNYFQQEKRGKEETIAMGENVIEDIEEIKKKISENENLIKENEKNLEDEQKKFEIISSKVKEFENEIKIENEKKIKKKRIEGEIEALKKEMEANEKRIKEIKEETKKEIEKPKLEEEQMKLAELIQLEKSTEEDIRKMKRELEKVEKLEGGRCPICKQEVSHEHVNNIREEYQKEIRKLEDEIKNKEKEVVKQREIVENEKIKKREWDKINGLKEILKEKERRLEIIKDKISKLKKENESITIKDTTQIEEKLKEKREIERKIFGRINSIKKEIELKNEELNELKDKLRDKEELKQKIETEKEKLDKIINLISLLTRLRGDIKNMREIVRKNYLEAFRKIFRRKFNEIRHESDYMVDIKSDYEPIAYANKEEVPIQHLSGGEKTSVALAYRLALSELASVASSIIPTKVIILDEPTTGLDREDVKSLAEAIKNITSIPQVIIVTHNETLKSYGDFVYKIEKREGESIIYR